VNEHIVNRIREWRLARAQMTQAELAHACGVTRQTIIALEAGKYSPSLELAFRLARALGRNLEEVFQFQEKN
jgi:putative transcriptional regulator